MDQNLPISATKAFGFCNAILLRNLRTLGQAVVSCVNVVESSRL